MSGMTALNAGGNDAPQQDLVVLVDVDDRAAMTPKERAELVLSFARVLHVKDQGITEAHAECVVDIFLQRDWHCRVEVFDAASDGEAIPGFGEEHFPF